MASSQGFTAAPRSGSGPGFPAPVAEYYRQVQGAGCDEAADEAAGDRGDIRAAAVRCVLADWMESYPKLMELNVWPSREL